MTASDFISSPPSALNVRNVKTHPSKEHGHAVARKVADLNEPSRHHKQQCQGEPQTPRRRKRDAFFALFTPSKHERVPEEPAKMGLAVSVQVPSAYMNPNHKGSLVSGKRVAYSRYMHQGRKAALSKKLESAIPEDEQVIEFPATQAQQEEAQAKAALETSETKRVVARSLFF
ncbi:hypothetical protein Gpo141_00001928 [Globisporangium polare]